MAGSGGSAGTLQLPTYMEAQHKEWLGFDRYDNPADLDGSIAHEMALAIGPYSTSPYEDNVFSSPDEHLNLMQGWIDGYKTELGTLNSLDDWQDGFVKALQQMDTYGLLDELNFSSLDYAATGSMTNVFTRAQDAADAALDALFYENLQSRLEEVYQSIGDINNAEDWDSAIKNAISSVDDADYIRPIDIDAIAQLSRTATSEEISEAVKSAVEAVQSDVINDLVAQYEQDTMYEKGRAIRAYANGMTQVNAVMSSSFLFGLALIEAENMKSIQRFRAEQSSKLFSQALQGHINAYTADLSGRVNAAIEEARQRYQVIREGIQQIIAIITNSVQFKTAVLKMLSDVKASGQQAYIGAYVQAFMQRFTAQMEGMIGNDKAKSALIMDASAKMMSALHNQMNFQQALTNMGLESERMSIAAIAEHETRKLNKDIKEAMYPFTIYQTAANILAAPSGAVGYIEQGNSPLGSAIGGALGGGVMGAQAGAQLGASGGPWGAGIGALLGFGAGLLGA